MPVTYAASNIKAGTVAHFAASTAPAGWIKANGAAVSRTTYAALFLAIGTTYGAGDGSTTFNVPDLRGEFVRGLDDGRGVDSGRALGASQTDAMQGHFHGVAGQSSAGPTGTAGSVAFGTPAASQTVAGAATAASTDGTNGTPRTAAETRPRNQALLACIKF